jgi:hypothetical protein
VLLLGMVVGVAAIYVAHHFQPMVRESLVEMLSTEFHSPVELDGLSVSFVNGLKVQGTGLRILYLAGPGQPDIEQIKAQQNHQPLPPMLTVDRFLFHIALHDIRDMKARIARVEVQGMTIHIPPHSVDGIFDPRPPQTASRKPRWILSVGKIECRTAKLYVETAKPGKDALRFDIRSLDLTDAGLGAPMLYEADLINPHPVGDVQAFGHLGPWQGRDPRATPIDGHFVFDHADLSTIKGITGTLSSTGTYKGELGQLQVNGAADVPNFALDISGHPEHLLTKLQMTVDGTTGDTQLNRIDARLGTSAFTLQGAVVRVHLPDNSEGHDISLAVQMPHGRMEDLLALGMKTQPPVMRGAVTMQAKVHIPPGRGRVAQKLQLAGDLTVQSVAFSNVKFQDQVDGLSLRAQGKPEQVKVAGSHHQAQAASEMAVQFHLADQLMTVPSLHYEIAGAKIDMDGVYSLDGNLFEFKGHVRTEATASQMVTGWKAMLLKPLDPLLKKNGAGLELPIVVTGAHGDFRLGLAMRHVDESTADMAGDLKAKRKATQSK